MSLLSALSSCIRSHTTSVKAELAEMSERKICGLGTRRAEKPRCCSAKSATASKTLSAKSKTGLVVRSSKQRIVCGGQYLLVNTLLNLRNNWLNTLGIVVASIPSELLRRNNLYAGMKNTTTVSSERLIETQMIIDAKVFIKVWKRIQRTLLNGRKAEEAVARDEIPIDIETDKVDLAFSKVYGIGWNQQDRWNRCCRPSFGIASIPLLLPLPKHLLLLLSLVKHCAAATLPGAAPVAAPAEAALAAALLLRQNNAVISAAAKLAAESGVDVNALQGSGRDGRVFQRRRTKCRSQTAAAAAAPVVALLVGCTSWRTRVPMSRLRACSCRTPLASQQENAILTTFNEVCMKPIMDFACEATQRNLEQYVTERRVLLYVLAKAAVAALKIPVRNASCWRQRHCVPRLLRHRWSRLAAHAVWLIPAMPTKWVTADIEQAIVDYAKKPKTAKIAIEDPPAGTSGYYQRRGISVWRCPPRSSIRLNLRFWVCTPLQRARCGWKNSAAVRPMMYPVSVLTTVSRRPRLYWPW